MAAYDVFVACGGDGTLQLISSELLYTDKIIGLLPMGTGNDFAKLFGKELTSFDFLRILKDGAPKQYDLLQVNDLNYCINTFGIGFDGVANSIASKVKLPIGKSKYLYAALKSLFSISAVSCTLHFEEKESISLHSYMVVITNGKWEGGSFYISPTSNPSDGFLDLTISTSTSKWSLIIQILRLVFGFELDANEFKRVSSKYVAIETGIPVIAHSDGEVLEPQNKFKIKVLPNALNIMTAVH